MAKILIIGCGSIGTQLAHNLAAKGHDVTGLKRNPPKLDVGEVNYFTADISLAYQLEELPLDFEFIFFIVSPDGRNKESYQAIYEIGLTNLIDRFVKEGASPNWIFISSTSVYGQSEGEWVDEESIAQPDNITSQYIRQAEQQLMDLNPQNIVVRFSGIYGPGREYLLRMAKQQSVIQKDPPYYTNRIHQQDCIGVLIFLLEQSLAGVTLEQCYLASDDNPATMWDVMSWLTEHLSCKPPEAKVNDKEVVMNKRCNNQRLKTLGYHFQYPDFKAGYLELIK
jgi:nucleoside-diphosphate-sugar epimerase